MVGNYFGREKREQLFVIFCIHCIFLPILLPGALGASGLISFVRCHFSLSKRLVVYLISEIWEEERDGVCSV